MKILVTGGTVFVSKYIAEYFVKKGETVYVLNRNSRPQIDGVIPIVSDRRSLGNALKSIVFDAVIDVTAYTLDDAELLANALGDVKKLKHYIFISSSAVYPETLKQPFSEGQVCGYNVHWGDYGTNKLAAEEFLRREVPQCVILRPPYLYGKYQNLYREPFVFECALQNRPFYVPSDGEMPLQLFSVNDLARFIEILFQNNIQSEIFNVGNRETISVNEWVKLCYLAAGKTPAIKKITGAFEPYNYFPFRSYAYRLDVTKQYRLMADTMPIEQIISEEFSYYIGHKDEVKTKNYFDFINKNFCV